MPIQKLKHHTYNDGILTLLDINPIINSYGKKTGEKQLKTGFVRYSSIQGSMQDNELASSLGYTLDKKVKVPKGSVSPKMKVKIKDEIFDIYKLEDSDTFSDFLYMQKVQ